MDFCGHLSGRTPPLPYRLDGTVARRVGIGNAKTAQRISISRKFGVDARSASSSCSPILEDNKPCAFPAAKAVAGDINRAAGARGRVLESRQRPQQAKRRETDWVEHRIVPSRQHEIDLPAPHRFER